GDQQNQQYADVQQILTHKVRPLIARLSRNFCDSCSTWFPIDHALGGQSQKILAKSVGIRLIPSIRSLFFAWRLRRFSG
ncbi:MAG: hypothetical protein WAU00_23165, partial [Caldilinea sp.]